MDEETQAKISRFFTEVGIINQLASNLIEKHLPGRMSATQFGLLGHLARRPEGETPFQLATAFQLPKTTMTHMLSVLEDLKLISIHPNPTDARSKIVKATAAGGHFLATKTAAVGTEIAPLIAAVGPERFTDPLPNLETIRQALDAQRDG